MARIGGKFFQNDFIQETPSGSVNGSNTSFTLSSAPSESSMVMIFVDGIYQRPTTDYTISGTTITMTIAPATAQDIRVCYWKEN